MVNKINESSSCLIVLLSNKSEINSRDVRDDHRMISVADESRTYRFETLERQTKTKTTTSKRKVTFAECDSEWKKAKQSFLEFVRGERQAE